MCKTATEGCIRVLNHGWRDPTRMGIGRSASSVGPTKSTAIKSKLDGLLVFKFLSRTVGRAEPELISMQFEFNVGPIQDRFRGTTFVQQSYCISSQGGIERNGKGEYGILFREYWVNMHSNRNRDTVKE